MPIGDWSRDVSSAELSSIGAKRTCTVLGLASSTAYQFQLVPFRGVLNTASSVFGPLSNVASGTTAAPVASVAVSLPVAGAAVGQTLQLTATPKDSNGNPLSGRTIEIGRASCRDDEESAR